MLDHFIAKNATPHNVNFYYTLAISYCTFCVAKHTILGPDSYTPLHNYIRLCSVHYTLCILYKRVSYD